MLGIVLRLAAASCFALMAAMVKLGAELGIHPVELVFWRFALSLPPTLLWIALGPGLGAIRTRRPRAHLWRAAVGLASMFTAFSAIILLPLAEATTINFAAPLFATILSIFILSEKVGAHRWAAITVGLIGILVVTRPDATTLPVEGLAVGIAAAFCVAFAQVTIRQISRTETSEAIVFWFALSAVIVVGMAMPFVGSAHTRYEWAILALTGLFGGLAQLFVTASLKTAPVAITAPFDYTQLIWAVGLGWLLFGYIPPAATWIGAAIVIASGLYTLYREQKARRR